MPETTVFDHYEVLRREDGSLFELGRGAMGITYKAFDTNLRCPVALKVINAGSIHSDLARQRFVREARSAAQLRHRNVASVFHLGVAGDTYFYAMEFIEGETVESLIRRSGPLDPILALRITVQVARALNAAQRHELVHRDIKPSNLMVVREDDELVVKVIDFGLAKSTASEAAAAEVTMAAAGFVGTPHFASPEQLEERDLDVRSDIYSLGITLWYMLVGEAPFTGTMAQVMSQHLNNPPPPERIAFLPEQIRGLLLRMIAKKPADRPQTAADLRTQIEQCIESLGGSLAAGVVDPTANIVLVTEAGLTAGTVLKNKGFYAGAIVGGRYELLRDLGENNSGWAFQAEDTHDGTKRRLLVLQEEWASDSSALTLIEREVEKIAACEHPNILRVLGIERANEASFIQLEWTDGFSFLELLRCRQQIEADEALLLLRQLSAGVDAAIAQGFRHLDFSLNQIFVHFPGPAEAETERRLSMPVDRWPEFLIKINALGITRELATSDTWAGGQTIVGDLTSTRDSSGGAGHHSIQSLAAVVYELLGGTLSPVVIGAIGTQPAPRYIPVAALPEGGNEVVKRALDPDRTFPTATEFCSELAATLSGDYRARLAPAPAPAASITRFPSQVSVFGGATGATVVAAPPPAVPRGRFPWLGIAAAVGCVAVAGGIWFANRPSPQPATGASTSIGAGTPSTPALAENQTPEPTETPAAGGTPALSSPGPNPDAPMKAKLQEAEDFETDRDWPKAIESYLEFARAYPAVDTGRIRLETLLSSLNTMFEKMEPGQFAPYLQAVTDAARQDIVSAMVILAHQLRNSDPPAAFAWYCAAAARGNTPAITQAGLMVSNGAGTQQDYAKAAVWFQWADSAGDAAGKTCLAECYLYGTGLKKDEHRAIGLLQEAVSGGDARAMNLLGTCNHQGLGMPKNYDEALKLFTRAHDLGFEDAAGNLGVLYINGDGVARDPYKAVNLFDEGAQKGSPYCMFLLARCLEAGVGIDPNRFEAEAWYRKAAAGGNPMAIEWCRKNNIPLQESQSPPK